MSKINRKETDELNATSRSKELSSKSNNSAVSSSDNRANKINSHNNDKPSMLNLSNEISNISTESNLNKKNFNTHNYINLDFQEETKKENKYQDFDSKVASKVGNTNKNTKDFKLITYVHAYCSL